MDCRMEKTEVSNRKNGRRTKAIPQNPQEEHKEIIITFLKTFKHFFGDIDKRLGDLPDPRKTDNPEDIDYSVSSLVFTGLLMFICRLEARRQVRFMLHTVFLIETYTHLFKDNEKSIPHGDTMNNVFCALPIEPVQEIVTGMTETLIDNKMLYPYRLFDKYHIVAVDATGMLVYDYPHCPHCLTKNHNGKTLYYHHVLEAKIVTSAGFVFSLMTEFIENPEDDPTKSEAQRKQDCETKAFYRLAKRINDRFPKLPIILTMDGLYAIGPVFEICENYNWKFMICLSDDQLSTVNEEFEALCEASPENHLHWLQGQKSEIRQDFRWANDIDYIDSKKHKHALSVLECKDVRPGDSGNEKITKFKWVTNVAVKKKNVIALANQGGRLRWKIENESFNIQKTGGYNLEHAYTNNENGIKVYYLVLQIAHMLAQLLEKGSLFRKAFPKGFGSAKNLAFRLLEALRNVSLSNEEYLEMSNKRVQIRFNST